MNQAELITKTAQLSGVPKSAVEQALKAAGEVISSTLAEGEEVTLPGIGKLSVTDKAAREGRNPKTGEPVMIAARKAVKFKATKALNDQLKA